MPSGRGGGGVGLAGAEAGANGQRLVREPLVPHGKGVIRAVALEGRTVDHGEDACGGEFRNDARPLRSRDLVKPRRAHWYARRGRELWKRLRELDAQDAQADDVEEQAKDEGEQDSAPDGTDAA
jgi:hypothetical protein